MDFSKAQEIDRANMVRPILLHCLQCEKAEFVFSIGHCILNTKASRAKLNSYKILIRDL